MRIVTVEDGEVSKDVPESLRGLYQEIIDTKGLEYAHIDVSDGCLESDIYNIVEEDIACFGGNFEKITDL